MAKKLKAVNPGRRGTVGRKTKLTPALIEKAHELAKQGAIQKEIAAALGISRESLCLYQAINPEFSDAIKNGRAFANQIVVGKLFKRACGYDVLEVKQRFSVVKSGKNKGQLVLEGEDRAPRHIPSDPTSMALWLNNMMPEQFSRTPEDKQGRLAEVHFHMTVMNPDGTESALPWQNFLKKKSKTIQLPPAQEPPKQ